MSCFSVVDAALYNASGLLFVVLGVFILVRAAGFPDLTVDGSFTVGAVLYSVVLVNGHSTILAISMALLGGALAGLVTWTINSVFGVGMVISGVLSMIIFLLSAPYISGGSTKSLLNIISVNTWIAQEDAAFTASLFGASIPSGHFVFNGIVFTIFSAVLGLVLWILKSRLGLRLRYVGSAQSPVLVPKLERKVLMLLALMGGNALVAAGGAVEAERRGGYTNNMGVGILLVALSILVLGEAMIKSLRKRDYLHLSEHTTGILIGTIVYVMGIQVLLLLHLDFLDLRLLTALFLLVLLAVAGKAHSSATKLF
jgi:putative ABC transport system permease protein